ncbi:hypothetical protein CCP4SC76_3930001 [Gammaproteobacteria bacterium]
MAWLSPRQAGIQAGFIKPPKPRPLSIEAMSDDVALSYVHQILREKANISRLDLIQQLYLNLSTSEVELFDHWRVTRDLVISDTNSGSNIER